MRKLESFEAFERWTKKPKPANDNADAIAKRLKELGCTKEQIEAHLTRTATYEAQPISTHIERPRCFVRKPKHWQRKRRKSA